MCPALLSEGGCNTHRVAVETGKDRKQKSQETGESKESQETGKIRHRGKSGNAKSQETGKVRKREEILKPEQKSRFAFCMLQPNARRTGNGNSQGTGLVRKRGKSGNGKATNPTFPTFPNIFVTWLLTFELTPLPTVLSLRHNCRHFLTLPDF